MPMKYIRTFLVASCLIGMFSLASATSPLPLTALAQAWQFPKEAIQIKPTAFWWRFQLAPPALRAYFQETSGEISLPDHAWIESTVLVQHPYTQQGQQYLFILLKNQPVSKQVFGEQVTGWLSGLVFQKKVGRWHVMATGQALGWLSTASVPLRQFQHIALGTQQIGFLCTIDLSLPKTAHQEYRTYLITQKNNTLSQIGIFPIKTARFNDEFTQYIEQQGRLIISPFVGPDFSPITVQMTTIFRENPHGKILRQEKEQIIYHYNIEKNLYFSP